MKLSNILAFLPFCAAAALPIAETSVKALSVSSSLVPRQAFIAAAMEAAFSWVVEGETTAVEAEVEISAEGVVTPASAAAGGAGVTVIEASHTGSLKELLYVSIKKLDTELGLEGHASMLINRATGRIVGQAKNLGLRKLPWSKLTRRLRYGFAGTARVTSI